MPKTKSPVEWTPELIGKIARYRAQGKSLLWISQQKWGPSLDQHYTRIQNDSAYKSVVEQARLDYGATLHERAVEIANEALTLSDSKKLGALRLAFDCLSYGAARSDPQRFSPTSQVVTTEVTESYVDVLSRLSNESSPKRTAKPLPAPSPSITVAGTDTEQ